VNNQFKVWVLPAALLAGLAALGWTGSAWAAGTGHGGGGGSAVADEAIRQRVEGALHSDPYFYDAHVIVSMANGDVLLGGFVSSDWDLLDAIRIARKTAGNRRVVNNLSIELGGRK
jgi:osmotically-inducible protein OsmY